MKFEQAYKAMQEGEKVRRKGWKCNPNYWFIENDTIKMCCFSESVVNSCFNEYSIKDTLADDWEIVEDKDKKKLWRPKENEKYFCIEEYIQGVGSDVNGKWNIDDFRFNMGNYFKTKKEAEHMLEKLKVIHELQKFAYENNEEGIEWGNKKQEKWYLCICCDGTEVLAGYDAYNHCIPFNVYFSSDKIAHKAIKTIGEDRIKKYYFGIEE